MAGMHGPSLIRIALLAMIAACGSAPAAPVEPAAAPGKCALDAAVAATRLPKPADKGCMHQEDADAFFTACEGGDAEACYHLAVCGLANLGASQSPTGAEVDNQRAALRRACDAGVAEACLLRVGVVTAKGGPLPSDGCADLVRACQLDEKNCFDCRSGDCD